MEGVGTSIFMLDVAREGSAMESKANGTVGPEAENCKLRNEAWNSQTEERCQSHGSVASKLATGASAGASAGRIRRMIQKTDDVT